MSALRFVSRGEVNVLDRYLAGDMTLHLYKLDVEAGLTDDQLEQLEAADFTEATFPGYAAVTLTGGLWSTLASDPSRATFAEQSFTRTSTGTAELIHGYYVTDDLDAGALAFYEQFDGPVSIEFLNDQLDVTPQLTLDEGSSVPTGSIEMFSGSTAPTGWEKCDGGELSRTAFAALDALYAAEGYPYGNGDGSTTFNKPDLRQRVPMGVAASGTGSTLGGTGGTIDHVHDLDTATAHAQINIASDVINSNRIATASWNENVVGTTVTGVDNDANLLGTKLGGSTATANPPFLAVSFIVKT